MKKMAQSNHRRVFNFSPQPYNLLLALSPLNQSTTKAILLQYSDGLK